MWPEAKIFFVPEALDAFKKIVKRLETSGVVEVVRRIDDASLVINFHPENVDTNQDPLPMHQKIIDSTEMVEGLMWTKDAGQMIPKYSDKLKERLRNIPTKIQDELTRKLSKKPERSSVILRMKRWWVSIPWWSEEVIIDEKSTEVWVFLDIAAPASWSPINLDSLPDGELSLANPTDSLWAAIMEAFLAEQWKLEASKKVWWRSLLTMLWDAQDLWKMDFLPSFYTTNPRVLVDLFSAKYSYDISPFLTADWGITEVVLMNSLKNRQKNTDYTWIISVSDDWHFATMRNPKPLNHEQKIDDTESQTTKISILSFDWYTIEQSIQMFLMNLLKDTTYQWMESLSEDWQIAVMIDQYGKKHNVAMSAYNQAYIAVDESNPSRPPN